MRPALLRRDRESGKEVRRRGIRGGEVGGEEQAVVRGVSPSVVREIPVDSWPADMRNSWVQGGS